LPVKSAFPLDWLDRLVQAPASEAEELVLAYLRVQVAKVLQLEASQLNIYQPLTDFGIDSLMAVEMKNRLLLDLKVDLPLGKLLEGSSLAQVTNYVLTQRKLETLRASKFSVAAASEEYEEIEL
jgi:acyl carrier protein